MNKIQEDKLIKKLSQVCGEENGLKWDLTMYIIDMNTDNTPIRIYFITKFFLKFEVYEQINAQFPNCKIQADRDRLVLEIYGGI